MIGSREESADYKVGPGTPMGDALRRYWVPACTSAEVGEPGGDPIRVWLLGQSFVAFRSNDGSVGLLDEFCPHRQVSLVYGRNEEGGLRCLWHQWKFAADGTIVDRPNVKSRDKVGRARAQAFPVVESGGLIWTYLGPKELTPAFPQFSWASLPPEQVIIVPVDADCNFVRPLEGLVDSSHVGLLHVDTLRGSVTGLEADVSAISADSMPSFELELTDFGFHYGAVRGKEGEECQVRVTAYVAPYLCFIAPGLAAHLSVPQDDTHSRFYNILWSYDEPLDRGEARRALLEWYGLTDEDLDRHGMRSLPPGLGPLGQRNHFVQDRAAMRSGESYSGRLGLTAEDLIMSCSIPKGNVQHKEHLVSSDIGVVTLRRILDGISRSVRDGGQPLGLSAKTPPGEIRAASGVLSPGDSWRSLVPAHNPLLPPPPTEQSIAQP